VTTVPITPAPEGPQRLGELLPGLPRRRVRGSRTSSAKRPRRNSAAFTGIGLDSTKRARWSGWSFTCSPAAFAVSPASPASTSSATCAGAQLAETLITPWPPSAMNGWMVKSSPESSVKRFPDLLPDLHDPLHASGRLLDRHHLRDLGEGG